MELQSRELDENMAILSDILQVDKNFDIIYRVIEIGGKRTCFYCLDGFTKDEILQKLMQYFVGLKPEDMPEDAHGMSKQLMPYGEVDCRRMWKPL